jgi:hypothetical protein
MAVARCELGVREIDWVVALLDPKRGERPPHLAPKEQAKVIRELRRAQRAAHEAKAREEAHTRKIKAAFRTAPGKDTEVLDMLPRRAQ